ncbi:TPA: DEAD/DEAH box helicase family protein [Enterobacter hormaechei subsp. xiangfangensis]|nr:DEAD/DEAH box helicase family protein [Enterobacter hormaechei subsp. xiangfangensis]HAV1890594.1 DEAD/DEAH box helicase family protein [Enterobacter hormaechei subsp. xiangfangensis]
MDNKTLPLDSPFFGASSFSDLIRIIESISTAARQKVEYGVTKVKGTSIERTRRNANAAAISLLSTLPDDFDGRNLTDEQRSTLAAYTGEGGIGGSEYEYYTPQHVAAGMWDMMKAMGAGTGHILEPSAGAGIFHEEKPRGVLMSAAELSPISGRINQLLHPEDRVQIGPFETLANNTEDETYDHIIGNVPFADNRGSTANLDLPYASVENVGHYFVLRTLDKLKAGGLSCLIVPVGFTSGSTHKKFRAQVSRKAEFLGAHRLPSGTFDENGTATPVDVWVLRKHPSSMADTILELSDNVLEGCNVLWPTFINGKWFELDGRRFQYGEASYTGVGNFKRLVIKNDQITNPDMRKKLAHRFDSRITWEDLGESEPDIKPMVEGEKRFINGVWYEMRGGRLAIDTSKAVSTIDGNRYGVASYGELAPRLNNPNAVLSLPFKQLQAIATDFPEAIPHQYRDMLAFAMRQKPQNQARAFRGSLIGQQIGLLQAKLHQGYSMEDLEGARKMVVDMVNAEIKAGQNPNNGTRVTISGGAAGDWLKFKASIHEDGTLSDFLQGKLDTTGGKIFNSDNHEECVRHLYNDIDRDPITIADLREVLTVELPGDDVEALAVLATIPGIAVTTDGDLLPMDRATSGDIGLVNQAILGALAYTPDGPVKENYLRQLQEIRDKREWTEGQDIRFKLDARWHDRRLVREFLHEQGFEQFEYVKSVDVEEGQLVSDLNYSGADGVFIGYRFKTVNQTNKETGEIVPVYKEVKGGGDAFGRQLETYLNGGKPRGVNQADYINKIRALEEDFNVWVRTHDSYDELVTTYNDAFNKDIRYKQSDAALGLVGVSGKRVPFGYQNEEVRRLSEDGKGILGFGTGLGKTTTGLALEAFNFEKGRTKRTAFVVPKAVYENWYHEAQEFFSPDALRNYLFVGLDELRGEDGAIKRVPVLDEEGQPVVVDGVPVMRNAVALSSSATIKERMNMIPNGNYRAVVMTKEQYAAIPMRPETVEEHAQDVLFAAAAAGRVTINAESHREANKKNRLVAEASKTGSEKEQDFPYFEDMHFDSVIADEGHNYRNSYGAGREASQLAYLPNSAVAKSARDMAVKNAYMMKKNNGRGAVMLTATPLVNSPIDAFNMLSHIVPASEWQRMGIHGPDDFVKMFGKTEQVFVTKIDGTTEAKEGLVGFQNLKALRGIFNRWTTMKTAQDVSNQVKIPDLEEYTRQVPLTREQEETYEELRLRATKLSNPEAMVFDQHGNEVLLRDGQGNLIDADKDSIFSIIRDMDRLCIDPDLYARQMTFRFPIAKKDNVAELVSQLPKTIKIKDSGDDDEDNIAAELKYSLEAVGDYYQLTVPELYEDEVLARLAKNDLALSDISHPIPPKYSSLIEHVKAGLVDGKQIIFSDEKTQHKKLQRILAQALGMDISQIGILNATTVADAAKGKKVKAVKKPDEPGEDATAEQLTAYYQKMRAYEDYVGTLNDVRLGGLESIAADYNEGRTRIIICNKKAEVGINLHKGTADVHHLTLPWTPASINQRNGRGARVGSTQAKVRVHYYCGKGSFDEFRLGTLKRKGNWIGEVMTSDAAELANADAANADEMNQFLAVDDAAREQQRQAQIAKIKKQAKAKAVQSAKISLQVYIKAKHAASTNSADIERRISDLDVDITRSQAALQQVQDELKALQVKQLEAIAQLQQGEKDVAAGTLDNWRLQSMKSYRQNMTSEVKKKSGEVGVMLTEIGRLNAERNRQQRVLNRIEKAEKEIRRYRPEVERAVRDGLLDADGDLIDHADQFYIDPVTERRFRAGRIYRMETAMDTRYVRIIKLDIDTGAARIEELFSSRPDRDVRGNAQVNVRDLEEEATYDEGEISRRQWMQGGRKIEECAERLTRQQFTEALREGWLLLVDERVIYHTENGYAVQKVERAYYGNSYTILDTSKKFLRENADKIMYLDPADEHLKTAVAKWMRKEKFYINSIAPQLRALFGGSFIAAMDSYGEQCPADEIREKVSTLQQQRLAAASNDNMNMQGNTPLILFTALTQQGWTGDLWINRSIQSPRDLYGDYANQKDFDREWEAQYNQLCKGLAQRVNDRLRKYAEDSVDIIRSLVNGAGEDDIARIEANLRDNSRTVKTWELLYRQHGDDTPEGLNLRRMYADAVIGQLCNMSDITATMIASATLRSDLNAQLSSAMRQFSQDIDEWRDGVKLSMGLITQEQIDAANQQRAEKVQEEGASNTNIIIKKNASNLRGGKSTNRYDYDPGECWCLHDVRPDGGALRRAKDELKAAPYGAKYYKNDRNQDAELVGSWWLIESSGVTANELAAIIQRYE